MNRLGMAIAAVLNALSTRTSVKAVAGVQGTGCELFLIHAKSFPEHLRIELSRPLGVIRSARASALPGAHYRDPAGAASPAGELTMLARPPCGVGRSRLAVGRLCSFPRCVALTAVRATADHQCHVQTRVRDHHGRS